MNEHLMGAERERERHTKCGSSFVPLLDDRGTDRGEGGDKKHNIIPRNGPATRLSTSGVGISSALLLGLLVCLKHLKQAFNWMKNIANKEHLTST